MRARRTFLAQRSQHTAARRRLAITRSTSVSTTPACGSSLGELRRVMRDGAPAVLVVQDNYYKDLHNDTAQILGEMAVALGFPSAERQDFPVIRNRASMNPRTRQYRTTASAVESILVLQ